MTDIYFSYNNYISSFEFNVRVNLTSNITDQFELICPLSSSIYLEAYCLCRRRVCFSVVGWTRSGHTVRTFAVEVLAYGDAI